MTEQPVGPTKRSISWLIALSAMVAFLVWAALWQIQTIAIDNARTPQEAAQCIAELPEEQVDQAGELCSTEPNIIFAARNPIRNSMIVFGFCLTVGFSYLVLNERGSRVTAP
jgi:hypothetical protein